ncbi:cobalamin biosynthesis protein CobW [Salinigranum rubrum]|uniref:Cobalamin biosynthesis protein CobW n=1 Tax=Salinigranum rubrum TaxID=755307 RepID=A0A2I8VP87_9EURY|nr:GTP-binding protein [Salinigranum rubrum]AUV83694.1 cobalamin biosynthesis protein CobW [Salinigranum rubrum]
MASDDIPVTILSGSLGAGKTTLLNRLLDTAGDRDIAVLVNDMGEINVDAELVSGRSANAAGSVTELSNGCICCELRGDLDRAVMRLARERDFDHLVVEASGISEPGPVAKLFTRGNASARYVVDALVTVVDARQFYDAFGGAGEATRRGAADDDTRPLSDLLVEQVELANVVLLNKTDLVSDEELATVEELVHGLRPDAEIIRTEYSTVDPDRLLGRRLYDPARAAEAAGWRQALADAGDGDHEADEDEHDDHDHEGHAHDHDHGDDHSHDHDHGGHSHPEEAYGVTSFVYRRRRPFHPGRLADLLADLPPNVVRSKGTLWVAGRELNLALGQAGPSVHVEAAGPWVATRPEFEQDAYRRNRRNLEWDDDWGDRRIELVFIGTGFDEESLRARLDDCLLDDEAFASFDPGTWEGENPFPTEQGERVVLAAPDAA